MVGVISGAMLLTLLPVTPMAPASASTPAAHVSFTTEPGGGSPNNPLGPQPKVHVTDSSDAAVSGASVTLTLDVVFPADQPTSPPALTCANVTTDGSGDATFAGCQVSRAGRYQLTATVSPTVTAQSSSFDISGLSQLTFTPAPPTTATAGVAWGSQPVVTMQTTAGDTVDRTDHIGLLVTTTGGSFSPLTCTQNPVVADHGVATFAGCKINAVGSGYTLRAVDADVIPNLLGAPSAAITVSGGNPTQLVFTHQPSGGPGGTAFAVQPLVTAEDAGGNPVPGYNQNVTLSMGSGAGVSGVALTCAHNPVAAVNGVAAFAGCTINKAHTGYTLTAHVTTPSLTATSTSFAITPGTASGIAFGTAPDGAHGGIAFTTQPVVNLADSGGNAVNGNVTLSLDASTNSEGAVLTCVATTLGTTNGHADFSGCTIDKNGTYQLTATSGTASVNTADLLVTEGSASQLVFHTTPTAGTGGTAFGTQPSVDVKDSGGNPASGAVTLTIAAGSGTPGAALHCASNTESPNASGLATFSGCSIDKAGLGYRLTATVAGTVTVTSAAFDVTVGPATKIAFTAQPGGGAGGEAWDHQPAVSIEDAGGNLVSSATATVTLTRTSGQGSGALTCKDLAVPAQHGVARFDDCAIDRAGTGYTLDADASVGSDTSHPFDITTGAPAALRFATQPGGAVAGNAFATQPVVTVVDHGNNVITSSSATVGLSLTPGTGTAGAALSCSSQSADQGTATFSGCSIDQAGGGYVLTATDSADHLTAESGNLSVVLAPPSPLGQAPTPLPLEQSFGGRVYGDNPTATTDKVNTATGALAFSSTDVSVAGFGEPFVLDRSYNSLDTTGGAFGRGWSSIFDISVKVVPGQTETVRGEDGQQLVWRFNPTTSSWVAPPGAHAQLTCGAKTCKLIRDDNVRWDVNLTANGRAQLVDYQAPDGQGLTFAWTPQKVTVTLANNAGTITGWLDSLGHVIRIDTPSRHVSYAYSSAGLLTSVTDVLGHTWLYGYDGSGKLTSITDPTTVTRLSAGYDGNSKVGSLQISGDQQRSDTTFTYGTSPQATTRHVLSSVAGAAPTRQDYVDRYVGNVLVAQSMPSGATMQYSYDANLRLIESQDALGWTSTYTYDGFGNLASQTVPVSSTRAATVRMQYDGQHRITSQTDATGNTTAYSYSGPWLSAIKPPATGNVQWTRFDYDGVGHLVDTVGPTNKRIFSYDAHGNMTKVVVQDLSGKATTGPATTFAYDEAGNRLSSTDPLGHTTTWTYDAAGHQTESLPALGNPTTNTFNAAGDPSSTTDPAGHTTEWSWNGSAGTRTTAVDHVTTLVQTYDPAGNLLRENPGAATDPGTTYTYDASGRQLTKTDAAGITTHYSYDLNS
ncbi:MAG: trimeric autotransporter adhesin, partial [Frankiales bacterium]|nr:trimeric autotransporter adhesin [Frankiales bacterium]